LLVLLLMMEVSISGDSIEKRPVERKEIASDRAGALSLLLP
jgi:hypothetical protein